MAVLLFSSLALLPATCRFGALEEVVKFPQIGYAFVTYVTSRAAADAFEALQDQRVSWVALEWVGGLGV